WKQGVGAERLADLSPGIPTHRIGFHLPFLPLSVSLRQIRALLLPPLRLGLRPSHLSPASGGEEGRPASPLPPFLSLTQAGREHAAAMVPFSVEWRCSLLPLPSWMWGRGVPRERDGEREEWEAHG